MIGSGIMGASCGPGAFGPLSACTADSQEFLTTGPAFHTSSLQGYPGQIAEVKVTQRSPIMTLPNNHPSRGSRAECMQTEGNSNPR